ncbi:MAG: hypothetical protein HY812_17985 [Planctomycetes bacterium]|nr:hypothetical protein [Planctomycetota bacterium]
MGAPLVYHIGAMPALGALLLALLAALLGDSEEREPGVLAAGKVFEWRAEDGLGFEYYVPAEYDGKKGANLLFILHGSNLDRRWGFAQHEAGRFRRGDIIVCPDGTTPGGAGACNFRQADKDLRRFNALQQYWRQRFNVKATYLYGHGQGAHFALLYAGTYPDQVQGVLAHAGGVWAGTKAEQAGSRQAIALMHGTADPVAPFAQSAAARKFYREAGYAHVRLRALRDGLHAPDACAAEEELAWCEGMTSEDAERVQAAFELLEGGGQGRDHVALYEVALRLPTQMFVPPEVKERARRAAREVEELAARHAALIEESRPRAGAPKLEGKPWIGHFHLFLQQFDGAPACETFRASWEKTVKAHRESAAEAAREYREHRESDPARAFVAGVDMVAKGFLAGEHCNKELLDTLVAWRQDAAALGISKTMLRYYDKTVPLFQEAMRAGAEAFDQVR